MSWHCDYELWLIEELQNDGGKMFTPVEVGWLKMMGYNVPLSRCQEVILEEQANGYNGMNHDCEIDPDNPPF